MVTKKLSDLHLARFPDTKKVLLRLLSPDR